MLRPMPYRAICPALAADPGHGRVGRLGSALWAVVVSFGLAGPGCGDDSSTDAASPPGESESPSSSRHEVSAAEQIEAATAGDVPALLALLARPHADVRTRLGPHTLTWTATFDLTGKTPPPESRALDAAVVQDQHIVDQGTLSWESSQDGAQSWSLSQQNDHERGRDVVAHGAAMSVRMRHRSWIEQPFEPHVVETWLDDAMHVPHDAIDLAAPRLAISGQPQAGVGLAGAEGIVLTLSLSDDAVGLPSDRPAALGVRRGWRSQAEITGVSGTLTLDAATGVPVAADLGVQYALPGGDGRSMAGSLTLKAAVAAGASVAPTVADALPLPQRRRTAVERAMLLKGL